MSKPKEKTPEELIREYKSVQLFNAYSSIKNVLRKIYNEEDMSNKKVYLIGAYSISKFIEILKDNKIFENIHEILELKKNEKNSNEEKLKESFKDFDFKNVNPEIYSYYPDCEKIFNDGNDVKNEFVIVDGVFTRNFLISDAEYKYVYIEQISKIEDEYIIKIKFPITQSIIIAREKEDKVGLFKFIKLEEKKENEIKDEAESKNEEEKNENEKEHKKEKENEKEKEIESMIKSICFCLINIDSLKKYFLINGNKVNNDNNKICEIFFEMINANDKLDCSRLIDIIKESKLGNIKEIIPFIYNNLHKELVLNDLREKGNHNINNNLNPQNLAKIKSKISEIFYIYLVNIFKCSNCQNIIKENTSIYKYFEFNLKEILAFKKDKKELNIFDCFDCLNINKTVNYLCLKCSNRNINSFYKIEPKNEILTIILDRGINFQDNITFNLDYNKNINLDYYLKDSSETKFEFELINFSSYYPDENKFYSFFKNTDGNWYFFNGEKINQCNNESFGIPVLLFYKKKEKEINSFKIIEFDINE